MANGELIPVIDFAQKIKAKYPQYKDVDDAVLAQKMIEKYPQYKGQVDMGAPKKKENLPSAQFSSISGVPENAVQQVTTPKGIPVKISATVPLAPDYAKGLQTRLEKGNYDKNDIDVVAGSMGVSPVAANAYMKGDNSGGVIAEFSDIRNKKKTRLAGVVQNANKDLGLQDMPEQVLSSPEEASKYIDKIEGLYKGTYLDNKKRETIDKIRQSGRLERGDVDMNLLAGFVRPAIEETERKAAQMRNLIGDRILEQVMEEDLPYDAKVKKATALQNPRYAKLLKSAIADRVGENNVDRFENETTGQFEILSADKAVTEARINKKAKENIIVNTALLEKLMEQQQDPSLPPEQRTQLANQITSLKGDLSKMSAEYKTPEQLEQKYPTLFKNRLAGKLNEFYAIKSGNVKGYEGGAYKDVDVFEFLRNNGFDPKDQRVVDVLANQNKYLKDYSFFGSPLGSVTDVFSQAGKSIGDLTGIRDDVDRLEEKKQSEVFPTAVGDKDEYQLTGGAKLGQLIGQTSGQVIGQGLLQLGTANVGRMAGLSQAMAANTGFAASGVLTSFDQALKDSYDLPIDSKLGRYAYAGIISLANAASEKIFPEAKLLDIPGMKSAITKFAKEAGTDGFTKEAAERYMSNIKDKLISFGKSYGKNISQETLEETATSLAESGTRYLFGDPNMNMDEAIKRAKNTAVQTALGTSFIAGLGAARDMKASKNLSASSAIYNAALYPDYARDAIIEGYEQKLYDEKEKNTKIAALNTAVNAVKEMAVAEKVNNTTLTRPQREQYVANLTAEKYLESQKKNTTDKVLIAQIDEKIANLQTQRLSMLSNEVKINDDGEVVEDVVEKTDEEGEPLEVEEQVAEVTIPSEEERVAEVVPQPSAETVTEETPVVEESVSTVSEPVVSEPEKPKILLNKDNRNSFITNSGRQKIELIDGELKVYDTNSGEDVSKGTSKKAVREFSEAFDFSHGELSTEPPDGISNEVQLKNHVVETSENPYEIAEVYVNEEPATQPLSVKERMIAEYGIGKVSGKSYNSFGDRNNMSFSKAKQYLSKTGNSIDVVAKEMSDYYGLEISPKDIVSFMDRFPKGEGEAMKEVESGISIKAASKFKELTGIDLNNEVAQRVIEKEFNKLNREQQAIAEYDYATREQLEKEYWKRYEETDGFTKESVAGEVEQGQAADTAKVAKQPSERDVMVQEAAAAAKNIKSDSFFATMLRDSAEGGDMQEFEEYMQNVSEQANDPDSRDMTVKVFGQDVVDYAQKMFPQKETETADRKDGLSKEQVGKVLDALDKLKINLDNTAGVNIFPAAWNSAVNITKFAIRGGMAIADAVNKGAMFLQRTLVRSMAKEEGKSFKDVYDNFIKWVGGSLKDASDAVPKYAKILFASTALNLASIDAVQAPVYNISEEQQEINGLREANIPKIEEIIKDWYAENDEEYNPVAMQRAISLWEAYGRPTMLEDTVRFGSDRPFAVEGDSAGDALFNIKNFDDFIAEMAHVVQYRSGAVLDRGAYNIRDKEYDSEYDRVGSVEYDAHKILESIIGSYIMSGPLSEDAAYTIFEGSDQKFIDHLKKSLKKYKADVFLKKDAIQFLDSLKIKEGKVLSLLPGVNLLPVIWNGGIEVIKKAVQGGMVVSDAIKKGIAFMKDEAVKNGQELSEKNQEDISNYISNGISEKQTTAVENGEAIFDALSKKSKAGTEMALEKIEGVSDADIAAAMEINDNFDAIVKKLKEQNKLKVICP